MDEDMYKQFQQLLSAQLGNTDGSTNPNDFFWNMPGFSNDPDFDLSSQMKIADEQRAPECYRAIHNSYLAKVGFANTCDEHNSQMKQPTVKFACHQTTRPAIEHGVAPDFTKDLKPITIEEVAEKVNHIHTNRVLFVTTIYAPYRIVGTNLLVEDQNQDCIQLSLYNYVATDEDPGDIFPTGTHLAILDPYMKNSQDDRSKNLMLRCDNPQCILKCADIDKFDKSASNPTILRNKGNSEFKRGNLKGAADFYSKALIIDSIDNPDKVACLSNRAEVRLRQQRWEDAVEDAQNVLKIQYDHIKARFRLGKALIQIGRIVEAQSHMEVLLLDEKSEDKQIIKDFISDCQRLRLEQNGIYDYQAMRKESQYAQSQKLHADYVSPKAEIGVNIDSPSGISYRGCKAVEDIGEDELIAASKAFAFAKPSETNLSIEYNLYEKSMNEQTQIQLVEKIVKLLWNRPCLASDFYSLNSGEVDYLSSRRIDTKKIDLPRIRRIVNSNTFGVMNHENEEMTTKWEELKRLQQVKRPTTEEEYKQLSCKRESGSGLWLTESLFNHSCHPNCSWTQIGDHMFIRSNRKIKKGAELCIAYCALDLSYNERKNIFGRWIKREVGFICACERCHLLRKQKDLLKLEIEVDLAFKAASMEVSTKAVRMSTAAEMAINANRRKLIMDSFAHLPLHLQYSTVPKLLIMEGTVLQSQGKNKSALVAYQKAAEIGYSARGSSRFEYYKDLWRITGAALACQDINLAGETLRKIWKLNYFQVGNAKTAFMDLTLHYAMPWWVDSPDYLRQRRMEKIVMEVCNEKNPTNQTRGKKKKNRKSGN